MDIQAMRKELTDARDQVAAGRKLEKQGLARVRAAASLVRAEIRKANEARTLSSHPAEYAALKQRMSDLHDINIGIGE